MKVGAIIIAQNNSTIDYTKLAVYSASQVINNLQIPVSLITDNKSWLETCYPDHKFDKVIEIPYEETFQKKVFRDGTLSSSKLEWRNLSRNVVYKLTPYDTTLVIDSDYIINSDNLKIALSLDYDFQIYKNSIDLSDTRETKEFKRINEYSIPFYWATVFIFKKSMIMKSFFDLIEYIKANWEYFRILYSIESSLYRNDFAFSIAIHIMNGKTDGHFSVDLPGYMIYCTDRDLLIQHDGKKMKFLVEKLDRAGEYVGIKTDGLDVHVMNKLSLSRFIDGGNGV